MKVASSMLLAAALGVAAHPSAGAHQKLHRKDYVVAGKPTTAAAAAAATGSAVKTSAYKNFCGSADYTHLTCPGGFASATAYKRTTEADILRCGNLGVEGNYGCNIMEVDESIADQYKNLITFKNGGSTDQKCACWNKVGPTFGINGFATKYLTPNSKFDLPANGKAYIAIDTDSQGACSCGAGEIPVVSEWMVGNTWVEFDMTSKANGGNNGADSSALVPFNAINAGDASATVTNVQVCNDQDSSAVKCSTIWATKSGKGAKGIDAYTGGTDAASGVGLNIDVSQTVRLTATIDHDLPLDPKATGA